MAKLQEYRKKRDFKKTREPKGVAARPSREPIFVIQQHQARRLHWDLRLEAGGVLKSWAVTNKPSAVVGERRLAVETEDHPRAYGSFEGEIPKGEYGAGTVELWDRGTYQEKMPIKKAMGRGLIEVTLKGQRLKGRFVLVRIRGEGPKSQWLFFKAKPKVTGLRIPSLKNDSRV